MRHTNKYYYKQNANVTNAKKSGRRSKHSFERGGAGILSKYIIIDHITKLGAKQNMMYVAKWAKEMKRKKTKQNKNK